MPILDITLPPPVPKPCNDCPWRRNAIPGWLGPYGAARWLDLAHGEEPIACHQTIPVGMDDDDRDDEEKWENTPGLRQCTGAAIFRRNVGKMCRNRTDASNLMGADPATVFGFDDEFTSHHTRKGT